MIECVTYRMRMHTTADDPTRYRKEEEVKEWEKRDPIPRFEKYLRAKGLLSDQKVEALETEVKDEIQKAVDQAEEQMKRYTDPLYMFEHVYAELPRYLQEQREELAKELSEKEEKGHGKDDDGSSAEPGPSSGDGKG